VALRTRGEVTTSAIDQAFARGEILRTHVLRPTWHFVLPSDIRWLLDLTGPRVHQRMAPYNRHLELDARTFSRALRVLERALDNRQYLTRSELSDRLGRAGLPMVTQRLAHVMMHAELEGVICSGPRRNRKFTYALLAERAPAGQRLPRDEALATLARRFFTSHGPATIRDFVWWSGLATADATRAIEIIAASRRDAEGRTYWTTGSPPRTARRNPSVHLLPIYDEYLVAYRDREAVPHLPPQTAAARPFVTFQHALVIGGQVTGSWRLARRPEAVRLEVFPQRRLTRLEKQAIAAAAARYARFSATTIELVIG
jgi:hypothetical protein